MGAVLALALLAFWARSLSSHNENITESRTGRLIVDVLATRASYDGTRSYVVRERNRRAIVTLAQALPLGATVTLRGRIEPLDESRNPGEPSERELEAERGITERIGGASLIRVDDVHASSLHARLARLHAIALDALRAHLPEPAASIVAGELWGERGDLAPDVRAEFQETGTVHVLVTAGLHVGLVAWLILSLCTFATFPRALSCTIAIAAVWGFAWFSGAEVPAVRAASMATIFLCARALGRATFSWYSLALAAVVVIVIHPSSPRFPSFWLSFCCVASIFAWSPTLERALQPRIPWKHAREAVVLAVATQIGTWPITAAMFLQFSTYGLIANALVVPIVPVTMVLGIAQLALIPVPALAQACANLNTWCVAWMLGVVHVTSTLPIATVPMTPGPAWAIALYEATSLAAASLAGERRYTLAAAAMLYAASYVLLPPHAPTQPLTITVLDVGQADAIVIETPAHHAILVDAGGQLERGATGAESSAERVGERIVVPFLLRRGIHALDALIVSHPHGDHVAGCAPVLRAIRVAEIADGGQMYGGHAYHDCLDTAAADHVQVVQPRAGMVWRTDDGATLTFIGPSLPLIGGKNAINDNSVAFILQYRKFRMFFTGDAGVAAERRFLNERIDLHADVLKVGHHGSAYSSSLEFITAVQPRYAVISVGRHNVFGHPAPSTIETLNHVGSRVYRTDEAAAVLILSNGVAGPTIVPLRPY